MEIDIYSTVLAAEEVQREEYALLLEEPQEWFLDWLLPLELEERQSPAVRRRVQGYLREPTDKRRMLFASILERTLPEARKAPLVIYRLYSRAVRLMVAVGLSETLRAERLRREQINLLPHIADCSSCRGQVLENGESCRACGNPLWRFDWLCSAD